MPARNVEGEDLLRYNNEDQGRISSKKRRNPFPKSNKMKKPKKNKKSDFIERECKGQSRNDGGYTDDESDYNEPYESDFVNDASSSDEEERARAAAGLSNKIRRRKSNNHQSVELMVAEILARVKELIRIVKSDTECNCCNC